MGDVTLSTGKVVSIDTSKMKFGEWRSYFKGEGTSEQDDAFITKATGLKREEIADMLRADMTLIVRAIIKVGNEPLTDPNSQGESTKDSKA